MFKKKTKITIELLENGKFLLETSLNEKHDPELLISFWNRVITREYLPFILKSIEDAKCSNVYKEEIIDGIIGFQNQIEIRPAQRKKRNPLIRPLKVFDNNEDE